MTMSTPATDLRATPDTASADRDGYLVLPIEGMDCMDCARTLERGVGRLPGVSEATVNFTAARMRVTYAPDQTSRAQIGQRVVELGYRVGPDAQTATPPHARSLSALLTQRENLQTGLGALFTAVGGGLSLTAVPGWAPKLCYAAAILVAGVPVARKGWGTLRGSRRLDINVLMTIAIIGAVLIGDWLEAATVAVLFSVGEALEGYSADRARRSIRSLMALAPADALVRRPDGEQRVAVADLVVGDLVVIRPGERIPVDGRIASGQSAINEAPVTGESIPVEKGPDAAVFAGTMNGMGLLEVEATRPASDSTIARIIRMVEDAQEQQAPTQRFIDTFAAYYTPAVVAIAALVAFGPPLLLDASWSNWVYRALVLLVVACPCALVISTPVTIVSAIAAAARNGVLIKGGAHLEAAGSLRALAFDKTGTLTKGTPALTSIVRLNGLTEDELLWHAAAVERYSEHPLGAAIVRAADARGIQTNRARVEDVQALGGRGIEARIGSTRVRVGTRALVLNGTRDAAIEQHLVSLEQRGQTAVLLALDDEVVGVIGLADEVRPEAATALRAIKAAGIRETVMLTGDRRDVAQAIAAAVGVDAVEAELLPDDKVAAVERLLAQHAAVGMVGDGVNDAPALARATVGFAMGAAGSDTALETADIALMSDDLSKVAETVRLSRRAKRVIAQNIALAFGIKLVFLALAVTGAATLWEAVFADVGASLIVTTNGLRLLRRAG